MRAKQYLAKLAGPTLNTPCGIERTKAKPSFSLSNFANIYNFKISFIAKKININIKTHPAGLEPATYCLEGSRSIR